VGVVVAGGVVGIVVSMQRCQPFCAQPEDTFQKITGRIGVTPSGPSEP
jgi:hypothetical protein